MVAGERRFGVLLVEPRNDVFEVREALVVVECQLSRKGCFQPLMLAHKQHRRHRQKCCRRHPDGTELAQYRIRSIATFVLATVRWLISQPCPRPLAATR